MKSILPLLLIIFLSSTTLVYGQTGFYQKRWSDVYRYERKFLTKSALGVADSIYTRAKREKNTPQLVKVLMYQSKFALTLQEDAELVIIEKFQKEIRESKAPLKNILESVLANLYWQYFKEHRWAYYSRSRTKEKVNAADFRTWDADAMFLEVHRHFQNSLRDIGAIGKIDLTIIDDILEQAESSKTYRPTLYDFLAHNALDFYKSNDSFTNQPITTFALNDPAWFEEFESMLLTSPDSLDPKFQALKIFQKVLLFHKQLGDTTPYVNLQIERLNYLTQAGTFEDGVELHKKALQKLRASYQNHAVSALFDFELASIFFRQGSEYEPKGDTTHQFKKHDAMVICDRAIAAFPKSGCE